MIKYSFLYIFAGTGLFLLGSCNTAKKDPVNGNAKPPNVIVVLVDDLRWDEFGLGGHNYIKTPNIDRMAREGVRFTNAFSTTPLCSPSRASFLTGQYAHTHGITDNTERSAQSHRLPTFPAMLDRAGYETAFIGKWHMGNDNSPRPGFDYWAALKGQGEAIDPDFNINGEEEHTTGYVTDILTEFALQFVEKERDEPFLLYLSHKGLHPNMYQGPDGSVSEIGEGGFIPAERHKGMYRDAVFKRRPNAGVPPEDKPALMRRVNDYPPFGSGTATPEEDIRERAEMLMAIDEGLGKIMETLKQMEELDNTFIVFTSDHGYWYGEHGLNEERRLAYEEGIRIPLLIRYPPLIEKGTEIDRMVLNIDLAPTVLELAGHPANPFVEGQSFLPFLKGGDVGNWRSSFLIEYYSDTVWPSMINMGYKAIRTGRYKYIRYTELPGMDEFYDLEEDPYELKNQIHNQAYEPQIRELKRLLETYPEK